jgi:hypothetical protein
MARERVEGEVHIPLQRGREAISTLAAVGTQINLMHRMVPDRLQSYMGTSDSQHVGIEDKIFTLWSDKYGNGFKDFCDEHADDTALLGRIENMALTEADYEAMKEYLKADAHGGAFFTESELEKFINDEVTLH